MGKSSRKCNMIAKAFQKWSTWLHSYWIKSQGPRVSIPPTGQKRASSPRRGVRLGANVNVLQPSALPAQRGAAQVQSERAVATVSYPHPRGCFAETICWYNWPQGRGNCTFCPGRSHCLTRPRRLASVPTSFNGPQSAKLCRQQSHTLPPPRSTGPSLPYTTF